LTATGLDANFWSTPYVVRDRFVLVCGLIAQERLSINMENDLSPIEKDHLFTFLEEKLDYPANLEESVREKVVKAAILKIGTFQRWFKAHLRKRDNFNHAIMILLNWRYAILTHMSVTVMAPTCQ
jgi:hypothetical protein